MPTQPDLDALPPDGLKCLVVELSERVGELSAIVLAQRDEIARLKGLKGRPDIKPPSSPSGMEKASRPAGPGPSPRRGGGPKTSKRVIHEECVLSAGMQSRPLPPGSRFKGYEDFVVQDIILRPKVIRYWSPDPLRDRLRMVVGAVVA